MINITQRGLVYIVVWIKKEKVNSTVTDFYLDTIGTAFEKLGKNVKYITKLDETPSFDHDVVVVSTATDAFRLFLKGKKYYFWSQGVWPEESKMRHNSKIRFLICNTIERIALKHAQYLFFVSDTMRSFYEKKYRLSFNNKCYIMPCSNDVMHKEAFVNKKYSNNVFCYVGGTSVWQCFEETIELYSKIEQVLVNSKLLLLVKDKKKAIDLINKYKVKNYEIDYVDLSELPSRLSEVKFGFVLRKNDPVNYVATPTKVLTYISSGVIPIYSDSLAGIKTILTTTKYKVEYHNDNNISNIIQLATDTLNKEEILKEYMGLYATKYDRNKHIQEIIEIFK